MIDKTSRLILERRQFLLRFLPAGTLFCIGCGGLMPSFLLGNQKVEAGKKHKFLDDAGISFQDVYDFAYKGSYIPFLQNLAAQVGESKFIEMLKKASDEIGMRAGQEMAKSLPANDLATFMAWAKKPDRFWQHVLTFEIVEDTPKAVEVKVSECLWAKTFREAKASDIGYASICYGDYASAQGFNPKLKMIRTKTLMQGDDRCNHRYVWEG